MSHLDDRIRGATNGGHATVKPRRIECADGFSLSVISGGGTYSTPRPALCSTRVPGHCPGVRMPMLNQVECTYTGPFTALEVGFPSERPEPWNAWSEYVEDPDQPTETVYGYVPVEIIRALIDSHGGEVA